MMAMKLLPFMDGLKLPELLDMNRLTVERIRLMQKAGTLAAMSVSPQLLQKEF